MNPVRSHWLRHLPASLLCLVLTAACHGANSPESDPASNTASKRVEPKPTAENLRGALNADYVTPPGTRQECLGRLMFDAPQAMEWSYGSNNAAKDSQCFAKGTCDHPQMLNLGEARIAILPAKKEILKEKIHSEELGKQRAIEYHQERIALMKGMIEDFSVQEGGLDDGARKAIADYQKEITDNERAIPTVKKTWKPFDLGLPDSAGYASGTALTAWLWRNGYLYEIVMAADPQQAGQTQEETWKSFISTIQKFRSRKLYEVPTERGICIPFGFWPDDGTVEYNIGVQMRWADHPNVIYHWQTGMVGKLGSEATLFNATAAAAVGLAAGAENAEVAAKLTHRIGPRQVTLGGLRAEQGGVAINLAPKGKPPIPNYSVYTGYGGWGGSQMLPFILIDMQSYTHEQVPSFKNNPPPFEESLARLNAFLASMRLRPTDQPMPELLQIKAGGKP